MKIGIGRNVVIRNQFASTKKNAVPALFSGIVVVSIIISSQLSPDLKLLFETPLSSYPWWTQIIYYASFAYVYSYPNTPDLTRSILRLTFSISVFWSKIIVRMPEKSKLVDAILLFVCQPDDAEVAAGDLFEQLEKVQRRHGKWYCNLWFFWELSLLIIVKGRKRLTNSVLGPLADLWKRKSG